MFLLEFKFIILICHSHMLYIKKYYIKIKVMKCLKYDIKKVQIKIQRQHFVQMQYHERNFKCLKYNRFNIMSHFEMISQSNPLLQIVGVVH